MIEHGALRLHGPCHRSDRGFGQHIALMIAGLNQRGVFRTADTRQRTHQAAYLAFALDLAEIHAVRHQGLRCGGAVCEGELADKPADGSRSVHAAKIGALRQHTGDAAGLAVYG